MIIGHHPAEEFICLIIRLYYDTWNVFHAFVTKLIIGYFWLIYSFDMTKDFHAISILGKSCNEI